MGDPPPSVRRFARRLASYIERRSGVSARHAAPIADMSSLLSVDVRPGAVRRRRASSCAKSWYALVGMNVKTLSMPHSSAFVAGVVFAPGGGPRAPRPHRTGATPAHSRASRRMRPSALCPRFVSTGGLHQPICTSKATIGISSSMRTARGSRRCSSPKGSPGRRAFKCTHSSSSASVAATAHTGFGQARTCIRVAKRDTQRVRASENMHQRSKKRHSESTGKREHASE